jgi:hypothetical protein
MAIRTSPANKLHIGQRVWVYAAPHPPSRAIVTEITYTSAVRVKPNGDAIKRLTWQASQVYATREDLIATMRNDAVEIMGHVEMMEIMEGMHGIHDIV